ncbi:MAG: hypothetical protein QT00_C0001G0391 [archaeon GW2011_AR5]|nr:MAG: hypothetical protein QT00_C0001G0391 [archaeon GW2011_AR5]
MGRARMYAKTREKYIRKMSDKSLIEKQYQEVPNKNITTSEVICKKCGFKARYKFFRCPECNEPQ